jgi:hypothetical protein
LRWKEKWENGENTNEFIRNKQIITMVIIIITTINQIREEVKVIKN